MRRFIEMLGQVLLSPNSSPSAIRSRHLGFGDVEFLAAKPGQRNAFEDVVVLFKGSFQEKTRPRSFINIDQYILLIEFERLYFSF